LISRKQSKAVIEASEEIANRAVKLAQQGIDIDGRHIRIDTLCLHGDHPLAGQNAKWVLEALEQSGIEVSVL
jgi:lactam utilization protein B